MLERALKIIKYILTIFGLNISDYYMHKYYTYILIYREIQNDFNQIKWNKIE